MSEKSSKRATQGIVNGEDTSKLTPKERHAHWTKSKIERAGKDDMNVISSKTRNLADYVNLLNINDKLMADALMSFGSNPRVTVEFLETTRLKSHAAKEMINTINAEICSVMNWKYYPPRGFTNPLGQAVKKRKEVQNIESKDSI